MKKLTVLAVLCALCACAENKKLNSYEDKKWESYTCSGEEGPPHTVKASFFEGGLDIDINDGAEKMQLFVTNANFHSGVLYYANGIEFWTDGKRAEMTFYGAGGDDCVKD
ncbi:MAG: MliC family protein [Rickettsiales bacterium]|nr:MliC family protein [Rickettsiales bacterium]